jgi:hypothetical protein
MHSRHLTKLLGVTILAAASVMALGASTAQAKYSLLLNGVSVNTLITTLEILSFFLRAENGLKVQCTGGTGTAEAKLVESGAKVTGSASATWKGCVWVGSEKTCTINDGAAGQIKVKANGEMVMPSESEYRMAYSSAEFGTIFSEGVFCTIPEEEVLGGSAHLILLDPLTDTLVKLGHLLPLSLKLGNSKVTEIALEVHIKDANDPTKTFAYHLVP